LPTGQWLQASCHERFLAVSSNNNNNPHKVPIDHILQTLEWSNITHVNAYAFGMKSNYDCFLWLDDIIDNPATSITIDIGYYLEQGASTLRCHLSRGNVPKFPMLSSYQRTATDDTFGTFYFIARDNGARVQKMRIYSTLVHTLKSFGRAAAFQTLPKTVTQMRTRVSQGADFLNFVQHF